jgi:hypothetical protein
MQQQKGLAFEREAVAKWITTPDAVRSCKAAYELDG